MSDSNDAPRAHDKAKHMAIRSSRGCFAVAGAAALGLSVTLAPVTAFAQAAPAPGGAPTAGASAAPSAGGSAEPALQTTLQNQGGRRVYVASQVIEVRGEIQRPYAFSLSGRASLGYTYLELPVHFVQEILDAVRRAPF